MTPDEIDKLLLQLPLFVTGGRLDVLIPNFRHGSFVDGNALSMNRLDDTQVSDHLHWYEFILPRDTFVQHAHCYGDVDTRNPHSVSRFALFVFFLQCFTLPKLGYEWPPKDDANNNNNNNDNENEDAQPESDDELEEAFERPSKRQKSKERVDFVKVGNSVFNKVEWYVEILLKDYNDRLTDLENVSGFRFVVVVNDESYHANKAFNAMISQISLLNKKPAEKNQSFENLPIDVKRLIYDHEQYNSHLFSFYPSCSQEQCDQLRQSIYPDNRQNTIKYITKRSLDIYRVFETNCVIDDLVLCDEQRRAMLNSSREEILFGVPDLVFKHKGALNITSFMKTLFHWLVPAHVPLSLYNKEYPLTGFRQKIRDFRYSAFMTAAETLPINKSQIYKSLPDFELMQTVHMLNYSVGDVLQEMSKKLMFNQRTYADLRLNMKKRNEVFDWAWIQFCKCVKPNEKLSHSREMLVRHFESMGEKKTYTKLPASRRFSVVGNIFMGDYVRLRKTTKVLIKMPDMYFLWLCMPQIYFDRFEMNINRFFLGPAMSGKSFGNEAMLSNVLKSSYTEVIAQSSQAMFRLSNPDKPLYDQNKIIYTDEGAPGDSRIGKNTDYNQTRGAQLRKAELTSQKATTATVQIGPDKVQRTVPIELHTYYMHIISGNYNSNDPAMLSRFMEETRLLGLGQDDSSGTSMNSAVVANKTSARSNTNKLFQERFIANFVLSGMVMTMMTAGLAAVDLSLHSVFCLRAVAYLESQGLAMNTSSARNFERMMKAYIVVCVNVAVNTVFHTSVGGKTKEHNYSIEDVRKTIPFLNNNTHASLFAISACLGQYFNSDTMKITQVIAKGGFSIDVDYLRRCVRFTEQNNNTQPLHQRLSQKYQRVKNQFWFYYSTSFDEDFSDDNNTFNSQEFVEKLNDEYTCMRVTSDGQLWYRPEYVKCNSTSFETMVRHELQHANLHVNPKDIKFVIAKLKEQMVKVPSLPFQQERMNKWSTLAQMLHPDNISIYPRKHVELFTEVEGSIYINVLGLFMDVNAIIEGAIYSTFNKFTKPNETVVLCIGDGAQDRKLHCVQTFSVPNEPYSLVTPSFESDYIRLTEDEKETENGYSAMYTHRHLGELVERVVDLQLIEKPSLGVTIVDCDLEQLFNQRYAAMNCVEMIDWHELDKLFQHQLNFEDDEDDSYWKEFYRRNLAGQNLDI